MAANLSPGLLEHPAPSLATGAVLLGLFALGFMLLLRASGAASTDSPRPSGFARRRQVARAAGRRRLRRQAAHLRPTLTNPREPDLGFRLGTASGISCWASVEDSIVVLGPPRSGKGLHLVIAAILDAPGSVITTSTRPDNLAATIAARRRLGPVAVFDPQGLADGVDGVMRWSPIRGCEQPQVAMARARALCVDGAKGVDNASFWAQQAYTAVRCLLHAAALTNCQPVDVVRWSLSALAASEAVEILRKSPRAAPAWATALEAILSADPRQRDSTWAMVANTFAPLADPRVLDALTPKAGEAFSPSEFLHQRGTLYVLGTSTGASAAATFVSALVEDIVESARRAAAASPRARLEPPLSVVLDEAANYPLPSLLPLMSEGGGSGISTTVVLQSLAQARSRWGQHEAAAIWDSAVVKVVLGGAGNADDLRDITGLLGTRQERRVNRSRGADGRVSTSTSVHDVPVLDAAQLRTLPFGQALLLLRAAPPVRLTMRPWTERRDATDLASCREETEAMMRRSLDVSLRG